MVSILLEREATKLDIVILKTLLLEFGVRVLESWIIIWLKKINLIIQLLMEFG